MGSKLKPGRFDCYANALPDEPMFVLLGRDPLAGFLASIWSSLRNGDIDAAEVKFRTMCQRVGLGYCVDPEPDKAAEALDCAMEMFAWREANDGRWREPVPATHDIAGETGQLIEVDADGQATVLVDDQRTGWTLYGGVRAGFLGPDPRHPGREVVNLLGGGRAHMGETEDGVLFAMSAAGLNALGYAFIQAADRARQRSVIDMRQVV